MSRLPRLVAFFALGSATCAGCSPTDALVPLSLDTIEEGIDQPTGDLELTDAIGVAYMVLGTREIIDAVVASSAELPGLNRSILFSHVDVSACKEDKNGGFKIDYECLGYFSGTLELDARGDFANENGDYQLALNGLELEGRTKVSGGVDMRVQGVANPTADERTILAPIAIIDGLPDRFKEVQGTGVVVDNTRGKEKVSCLTTVLDETFAFSMDETSDDVTLRYSIRDQKNVWDCVSMLDDQRINSSECRTPIGAGDFAILRF